MKIRSLNIVLLLVLGALMIACKSKKQSVSNESMPEKSLIKINVTQTYSYCGGAYPPDEVLQQLSTPKKLPNQKVFIRPGTLNDWNVPVVAESISDINGVAMVELMDGIYCIVYENKVTTTYYKQLLQQFGNKTVEEGGIDKNCLEQFIKTPEAIFEVKNGKTATPIIVNLHHGCPWERTPCLPFDGNLPPSVPPSK
jgi:hypothetical protein